MDSIYSDILIKAEDEINGKKLIDNESFPDVRQVDGDGLHHIITIVSDETCADIIQMENIRIRISEILKKLSMKNRIDISVISINESCIKLKSDFQEYKDDIFNYQSSQKGLSPVLSAVYISYLRSMKLKELYGNDSEKECTDPVIIVISDFFDNDNRYNGINDDTLNDMLNQINNTSNMEIIKIVMKCQHPNTRKHFSQNLSGHSFYAEIDNPENALYWTEKKLYNIISANNDEADNPFKYKTETNINHRQKISESDYKNGDTYSLSDNKPVMPIIIVVDASSSMKNFADYAADCFRNTLYPETNFIDLAVIMIHDSQIKTIRNFSYEKIMFNTINAQIRNLLDNSCGNSPVCYALDVAYKKLVERIGQYRKADLSYISPMLIVISDFLPNDFSKTDYFSGIADMFETIRILNDNDDIKTIKVKCGNFDELSQQWYNAVVGFSPDISLNNFIVKSYDENINNIKKETKIADNSDIDKLLKKVMLN